MLLILWFIISLERVLQENINRVVFG